MSSGALSVLNFQNQTLDHEYIKCLYLQRSIHDFSAVIISVWSIMFYLESPVGSQPKLQVFLFGNALPRPKLEELAGNTCCAAVQISVADPFAFSVGDPSASFLHRSRRYVHRACTGILKLRVLCREQSNSKFLISLLLI